MHPYNHGQQHIHPQRAQQAVHALTSALQNPYASTSNAAQNYQYSSHYAQAYAQQSYQQTTPEGYTLSSTYLPSLPQQSQRGRGNFVSQSGSRGAFPSRGGFQQRQSAHWYEAGNHRCTHESCTFVGSKKSVEIHMMDRHLIFPPGWENRKRKSDWDADPSLIGYVPYNAYQEKGADAKFLPRPVSKKIPIQGTGVVLDTPEVIDAWIAERKRRWPTETLKEEKTKKLADAIARGEISAPDPSMRNRKRQRTDEGQQGWRGRGQARGRSGQIQGRGRGRGGQPAASLDLSLPQKPAPLVNARAETDTDSDSESNSGSDIDPEKDAISSKAPPVPLHVDMPDTGTSPKASEDTDTKIQCAQEESKAPEPDPQQIQPVFRKPALRPRSAQYNPFSGRPSLLRNVRRFASLQSLHVMTVYQSYCSRKSE